MRRGPATGPDPGQYPGRDPGLTRRASFRRNGKATELLVGLDDGAAATLIITSDIPSEARLAVLDLDVTAEDVRGQLLRWDAQAEAWRPSGAED